MTQVVVLEPFETGSGLAMVGAQIGVDESLARMMVTARKARLAYAPEPTADSSALSVREQHAAKALLDDRAARMVGASLEQPADITRPVRAMGKLATRFGSGMWSSIVGTPTLTQGYTGWDGSGAKTGITSRTGMPDMLKYVPSTNAAEAIRLQSVGSNLYNAALAGKLMLVVYIESLPGYQVGGTVAGNIDFTISTSGANDTNGLFVSYNTNQLREGWNFLKFVMRNPLAYAAGNSAVEYHPFGINVSSYGAGADADIVTNAVQRLRIDTRNLLGASLYFDSIWTGWECAPQFVLGCDGGTNLLEYGLPVFDSYGWSGYGAFSFNTVDSGGSSSTLQTTPASNSLAQAEAVYAAGWDVINHTATHPSMGGISAEAAIAYQMEAARAYWIAKGVVRGCEFYASPQSSSSRLSEAVIRALGFKLQRHARKWNTSVTPWGIDNCGFVGAIDMGSASSGSGVTSVTGGAAGSITGWQTASKLQRWADVIEAYEDTGVAYWHGITAAGDDGTGEGATGDNLLLYKSAFERFMANLRARELAGRVAVRRGLTDFFYGANA